MKIKTSQTLAIYLSSLAKNEKQRVFTKKLIERIGTPAACRYIDSLNGYRQSDRYEITQTKRNFRVDSCRDKLAEKLQNFGNTGKYLDFLREKNAEKRFSEVMSWLTAENRSDSILADSSKIGKLASVEIECFFNSKLAAVKAITRIQELKINVTGKGDGSLRRSNDKQIPIELVLTFEHGDYYPLLKLTEALKGNASVNASCGLHVHFDQRGKSYNDVITLADKLAQVVPALKMMLPVSRRKNDYCRYNHNVDNRYSFINSRAFSKFKTLEVRGHSGTVDYYKIVTWVKIIKILADMPIAQAYRNINTLTKAMEVNAVGIAEQYEITEVVAYMRYRATLFASASNDNADYDQAA